MVRFRQNEAYETAIGFFLSSACWFVVAAFAGLFLASSMVAPDFGLYKNVSWLVFSRLRPVHTNTMIFGFVGSGLLGAMYYFVPHLVRTPLHSRAAGRLTNWLWNIAIAAGNITLMAGYSQSREYAEWIWPVDILVLIAFALAFYNIVKTVAQRKETLLYVSVWYAFAALIFTWFIYFLGNAVWHPRTGAITGMADGVLAWFYGHGIVGLFLTPLAVGLSYYVIPVISRAPLFSHALSLVGFWFSGFIALGGAYFVIPRIRRHPLYSAKLADIQCWLLLIGLTGFFLVLTFAGLIQGTGWLYGETVYKLLPELHLYFVARLAFGVMIFVGSLVGLYNMVRSLYGTGPRGEEP